MKKTTRAEMATAFFILISAGCMIHAQQAGDSRQTPRPSLEDTEKWIVRTFTDENTGGPTCEEYSDDGLGDVRVGYGPYMDCYNTSYDNLTIDQCRVTFEIHKLHSAERKNGMQREAVDMEMSCAFLPQHCSLYS